MEIYPIFPEFDIEREGRYYTLYTSVYLHLDFEDIVKVYAYPVKNTYVAKTKEEVQLVIQAHLRECFRYSKYMIFTEEMALYIPFIDAVPKNAETIGTFIYKYP